MDSEELMRLTLQQLLDFFYMYPECFSLEDPELSTKNNNYHTTNIIFQSQPDPNSNVRSIVINWSEMGTTLQCYIYFKELPFLGHASLIADAHIMLQVEYKWFSKSHRLYRKLRKALLTRKKDSEHDEYLKKLHSVFPGCFDEILLK